MAAQTSRGRSAGQRIRRVLLSVGAVLLVVFLALGAVVVHGARSYAGAYEGRILPGAVVAGVDVWGMTRQAALSRVRAALAPRLDRTLTLTWEGRRWTTSPRELGAVHDAEQAVEAALQESQELDMADLLAHRWRGRRLAFRRDVTLHQDERPLRDFVGRVAAELDRPAVDARLDAASGWVSVVADQPGRAVDVEAALAALRSAPAADSVEVPLSMHPVAARVTAASFSRVLLLRQSEHTLYLYDQGAIVRSWLVATGTGRYPTPRGTFSVTAKRNRPTWVNPAPTTWGRGMPSRIPPGPRNPLGVRAINWSAPAIRFHGTASLDSLGRDASHGCVRLSNQDVTELFDLIEVGTAIISLD